MVVLTLSLTLLLGVEEATPSQSCSSLSSAARLIDGRNSLVLPGLSFLPHREIWSS